MFSRRITLFHLFGFPIRIDFSWIFLSIFLTWSLAKGLFYPTYPDLSEETCWWMGFLGTVGLFVSILFHELAHALVARYFGLSIRGITLFIFGGVAELEDHPPHARSEFFVALAGPIASLLLAILFQVLYANAVHNDWPLAAEGLLTYLAILNFVLAVFNLIPAFPLDGGRILRSALWAWRKDIRWSTRIAASTGSMFGMMMIVLAFASLFSGQLIMAAWWFLVGIYIRSSSYASYQQLLIREALRGEPISKFISEEPVVVPYYISLKSFVEDYFYRYHDRVFPVVDSQDKLLGCIHTRSLRKIPIDAWNSHTVKELVLECSPDNTISINSDALEALRKMSRTQNALLMVVEDNNLKGIVSMKSMLQFLSVKMEAEKNPDQPPPPEQSNSL